MIDMENQHLKPLKENEIMSKRPSFQFYPGDWLSNTKLKRCTFEEKGIWVEILCLLHDSEEYGILRWSLEDIAVAVGCSPDILKAIVRKGVLKGTDAAQEKVSFSTKISKRNGPPVEVALIDAQSAPLWFSSRMVRDEYIRRKRGEAGIQALNHPNVPKRRIDKDIDKDTFSISLSPSLSPSYAPSFSPSPSSSSSSSKKDIAQCANAQPVDNVKTYFEEFWENYPRKKDKGRAHVIWKKKNLDLMADKILADVKNRIAQDAAWQDSNFIPYPKTYLQGERWNDAIEKIVPKKNSAVEEKKSHASVETQSTSYVPLTELTQEQKEAARLAKENTFDKLRSKKKMSVPDENRKHEKIAVARL